MKGISTPPTIIPPRAMTKTGTYTGNGTDNRNIDIGVNLAAKSNVYVIVKSAEVHEAFHRIEYSQGDLSMAYNPIVDTINLIQQFTATGFQVGSADQINTNAAVYRYIVFWEEP